MHITFFNPQNYLVSCSVARLCLTLCDSLRIGVSKGFPSGSVECRRRRRSRFDPWVGGSPGGGNGNPLQYSCLENPMDRGTRWATVHGFAKSQTQLSTCVCTRAHTHTSVTNSIPTEDIEHRGFGHSRQVAWTQTPHSRSVL